MPDYKDSKIYKITCNVSRLAYYGSTTQPISKRMVQHRSDFRKNTGRCNSKCVLASGDYDYCLVEKVECSDKTELHQRERHYIETNECVNFIIPGRTYSEWYLDNKETILEYRSKTKEKMSGYQKNIDLKIKRQLLNTQSNGILKTKRSTRKK